MITAIDTNILLDVLIPNSAYVQSSKKLLETALSDGALIIGEAVYAELATQFPEPEALQMFLTRTTIRLEGSSVEALQRAGEAWRTYHHARRARGLQCTRCGELHSLKCTRCHAPINVRQHILTDFLVGAHALMHADRLLTRDLGYYRTYFDELVLLTTLEERGR